MKVLYDFQIFDQQRFGGISRIYYELINHFENDNEIEWDLALTYSNNEYLKLLPAFNQQLLSKPDPLDKYKDFLWGLDFRGKGVLFNLKEKFLPYTDAEREKNKAVSVAKIKEGNFDVFHPTYYDDYFVSLLGDKPFVLSVYDCIHQVFPEYGLYEKKDKTQLMLDKATRIVAISESTKSDLVNLFSIDQDKIDVTLLANSLQSVGSVSETFKQKLPQKYFLYVGGRDAYKNFMFFVQVFSAVSRIDKTINIVCTGNPFNQAELYLFRKNNLEGRLYQTFVNEHELAYLYKNAFAFVFPSMYEGFGLPVLEAFSCGCPVLLSHSSSLKEIGGNAAVFFDPKDPSAMLKAMKDILCDEGLRDNKIAAGFEQEKKFSWERTAADTKNVYKTVLNTLL